MAVFKIRRYLKNAESEVNTTQLIVHAIAFGLFTLSYTVETVVGLINVNAPMVFYNVMSTSSFVSQLFLVWILYNLSLKSEEELPKEESGLSIPAVEEPNEEDHV